MTDLIEIPFYGDRLQACRDGESVSVVIKRVCEALGLDASSQLKKLKEKSWAVVVMSTATAADGKSYEVACLNLDALPMWLATIEPSRVSESVRAKLAAYQTECARVLRDHFFGRVKSVEPLTESFVRATIEELVAPLVESMTKFMQSMAGVTINEIDLAWLRREVAEIARLRSKGLVSSKGINSERRWVYNKLGAAVAWTGSGRRWAGLPAPRVAEAKAALAEMKAEALRLFPNVASRQLSFPEGR